MSLRVLVVIAALLASTFFVAVTTHNAFAAGLRIDDNGAP